MCFLTFISTEDSDSDHEVAVEPNAANTGSDNERSDALLNDPKLGAKKRAKLEAKLEKKAQREVRNL